MGLMQTAAQIWRDFVTDGVPSSGRAKPKKSDIRAWGAWVEQIIAAFLGTGGLVYSSRSSLFADLAHAANSSAWVIGDATVPYNGVYMKVGGSGSGSWTRVSDLPFSFILAADTGAGTPNAIQATSSIPISGSALVIMNVFEGTTGSPVTVSFNGGPALTIKTNSGNNIAPGGLVAGMQLLGVVSGNTFRLVSDQVSSAIIALAEAQAALAYAWAEGTLPGGAGTRSSKEWAQIAAGAAFGLVPVSGVGDGSTNTLTLPLDPGFAANVVIAIDGVNQQPGVAFTVSGTTLTWTEAPPAGLSIFGFIITATQVSIGAPDNNTVSTAKMVDNAVTLAKFQDIGTKKIVGRNTAGTGDPELLDFTAAGLAMLQAADVAAQRTLLAVAGTVVGSASGAYTANADITAAIPLDNTIPQSGEGTQIISFSYTPKSATNKLRFHFSGQFACSTAANAVIAIFTGGTNAIAATAVYMAGAGFTADGTLDAEAVAGGTSAITISVRVGTAAGTMRLNGSATAALFGGVSTAMLIVEEIQV